MNYNRVTSSRNVSQSARTILRAQKHSWKPPQTLMDGITAATLIAATLLLTIILVVAYLFDSDQIHKP